MRIKRILAFVLCVTLLFSNMIVSVAAEETADQASETTMTKTLYRYREKTYTSSKEELIEPWVLYNQKEEEIHGETFDIYLEEDEIIDTSEYCVHYKTGACKYAHQTVMSRYKWVLTYEADHDYYYDYDNYGKLWWHYADGYRYTCCLNSSKSVVTTYYYYQWSNWSEWSETPVEASDIVEVETKTIMVFSVSYDANGGTGAPPSTTKEFDEIITLSTIIPVRENHQFLGWSTASDGDVEFVSGGEYSANADVVLYAVWKNVTEYTVTYDANGGSGAPDPQTKVHDETIAISSEMPIREGYSFAGWSTVKDGEVEYVSEATYSSNASVLLYAVWEPPCTYTISYSDYGCTNAPAQQTKIHDIAITLSEQIPERQWHTFLGWAIHEDGEVAYYPGDTYSENSNITLYPVWKKLSDEEIIIASGYDSNELYDPNSSLYWKLSRNGILTLSGYGTMRDFQSISHAPWKAYREQIKKVIIQSGISSVGDDAFSACVNLTEIVIPDSILIIGDDAFYCTGLTEVTIPDSVTTVASSAFYGCDNLISIHIGKGVTQFSYSALSGCDSLIRIEVNENNLSYSSDTNGALLNKNQTTLIRVPAGIEGQYKITNSVTQIGTSAFNGCANLSTVIIPCSVTKIGTSAFQGCDNIASVYYCGTESEWSSIQINSSNNILTSADRYYHNVENEIVKTQPTCTINGEKYGNCLICGEEVTSIIPALGMHNYAEVITSATCVANGYTTHTCSTCGDSYVDSYVDAEGHSFGGWAELPTREERRVCLRCGHSETRGMTSVVASVGEVEYFSLNAALEAAAAVGGTVALQADAAITSVFIPKGVTLDLGEYMLTADYLLGVRGSYLTATPNAGKLVIEKDCLLLSEQGYKNDAGQYVLPIWDPENDCYLFSLFVVNTDTAKDRGLFIDKENEEIYFQFKHQATSTLNKNLLADGASDNALEVIVRLTWVNDSGAAYQDFVYNDGFIAKATGSYDYTFKLTGYSALNINLDTLAVTAMIVTDSGAIAPGTTWTAEMAQ